MDGNGFGSGDPRSDIGPIAEYLKDVTKLPPELTRIEQFSFTIEVDAMGGITATTPSNRIDPEYVFALRRIKGFISDPDTNLAVSHLITFNIADQGRARGGIFDDPINLAVLVNNNHDMVWDSFYGFVPGADILVNWTVATGIDSALMAGVSITGDLVRVRRLASGTLIIPGVTGPG